MKLAFRDATGHDTADRRFIVSTWSRSYKQRHSAGLIHTDDWPHIMHPQFEKILDRDGARAVLAYEGDDPDFFYGWIAGDTSDRIPVLHYIYVKESYRRDGIARRLFEAIGIDPTQFFIYVCDGPSYERLANKVTHARYDPHLVRYPKAPQRKAL